MFCKEVPSEAPKLSKIEADLRSEILKLLLGGSADSTGFGGIFLRTYCLLQLGRGLGLHYTTL